MVEVKRKFKFSWWMVAVVLCVGGLMFVASLPRYAPYHRPRVADSLSGEEKMKDHEEVQMSPVMSTDGIAQNGVDGSQRGSGSGVSQRLIVRCKNMSIEVKDLNMAYVNVEGIAVRHKGFIVSSNISETGSCSGTIVVKVPVEHFAGAVKEMKKLGKLCSEEETSEEVTEQHVDLTARLRNLKRQEIRYLDILNSAKKVAEMLEVEGELTRIRGDIESLQAQVEYLERSAAMSTITLQFSEPTLVAEPLNNWDIRGSFITAGKCFVAVLSFIIVATGAVLPLVILAAILVPIVMLWFRFRKRRVKCSDDLTS